MTMAIPAEPTPSAGRSYGGSSATPRLRIDALPSCDRNMAVAVHLSPFAGLLFAPLFLTPLVLWLIGREKSPFVDDHGRETLNFVLSFVLLHVILALTIIGLILVPILWIVGVVSLIRGAVAAGNGEYFRYPMTFRFLS
jgi:hypothetical protein